MGRITSVRHNDRGYAVVTMACAGCGTDDVRVSDRACYECGTKFLDHVDQPRGTASDEGDEP